MTSFRSACGRLTPALALAALGALAAVPAFAGEMRLDDPATDVAAPTAAHEWLPWTAYGRTSDGSGFTRIAHGVSVMRAGTDMVSMSRKTGFDPAADAMVLRFNYAMEQSGMERTAAQVLRVGSDFTTSNVDESDAVTYAKLGVNTLDSGTRFQLRDLVSGANSASFEGTQAVTWVINHTGGMRTYAAPDGTTATVGNNRMDVWVGRNKVFDDAMITTPDAGVSDVKWVWRDGSGITTVDRFEVRPLSDFAAGARSIEAAATASASALQSPEGMSGLGSLQLYRPSPNPFVRTMRYAYAIAGGAERVDIGIYDVAGRLIRNLARDTQSAGQYEVEWDGRADDGMHVRQGVYFLRASVGVQNRVARVVYLFE